MNRPLIALFPLFLTLPALAQPQLAQPQNAQLQPASSQPDGLEPPAQYQLQINGKAIPMTLDKEISLNRKAGRTRFSISRGATRHFEKSGVKFDYPTDYGFEADLGDPQVAIWTLSGRNSLLMVQRLPLHGPALLREQMTRGLIAQYGAKNVVVKAATLVLGGRSLEGKRLQIKLAKQRLTQEVFAFSNLKYAWVVMIQDAPQDGRETFETRQLKTLLGSSWNF